MRFRECDGKALLVRILIVGVVVLGDQILVLFGGVLVPVGLLRTIQISDVGERIALLVLQILFEIYKRVEEHVCHLAIL